MKNTREWEIGFELKKMVTQCFNYFVLDTPSQHKLISPNEDQSSYKVRLRRHFSIFHFIPSWLGYFSSITLDGYAIAEYPHSALPYIVWRLSTLLASLSSAQFSKVFDSS